MAGKIGGGEDELISEINVTPLVDIMLVLLIIFMLTSEAVTEKVRRPTIDVELPTASSGQEKPPQPLSVVINNEGKLYLNGDAITELKLREAVKAAVRAGGSKPPEAIVSADKRIAHGHVVRIIDTIRVLGVTNVAINTKAQEIE
jgi:biopolymer transport protein TolR